MKTEELLERVQAEVKRADMKHNRYNSAHEGFAVLYEKVDELWEHVRQKTKKRNLTAMQKEAIQVAAVAVRFARDVCK